MNQSTNISEIRQLASFFSAEAINSCIQLAMENKKNPCYSANELEDIMTVLAKASFVRGQVEQGKSVVEAIRELGKRMRLIQVNMDV